MLFHGVLGSKLVLYWYAYQVQNSDLSHSHCMEPVAQATVTTHLKVTDTLQKKENQIDDYLK